MFSKKNRERDFIPTNLRLGSTISTSCDQVEPFPRNLQANLGLNAKLFIFIFSRGVKRSNDSFRDF